MIAENNKELHETDKLFKRLIAPSLGSIRPDTQVHQHHGPAKLGPVLLHQRGPNRGHHHGSSLTASQHNTTRNIVLRTPPATEITLEESVTRIDGGGSANNVAGDFDDNFVQSYQASSGKRSHQQQRSGTSLSSASCSASVPWTFYSTTKMKQLPLPQVQSSEHLRASSPGPRGKKNVSISSERYLGTSRLGGGQPTHRRSKSAAEIVYTMSSNASSSDQVRRFEEERLALMKTRTLRRSTEVMSHRKDRKYHMCGSGLALSDRYLIDSDDMDRLRQFTQARAAKTGSSPGNYYGKYGGPVASGRGGTWQTQISPTPLKQTKDLQDQDSGGDDTDETEEVETLMPNVKISRTQKKKTGPDAFLTQLGNSEFNDSEDIFGSFKSDKCTVQQGTNQEQRHSQQGTSIDASGDNAIVETESKQVTAEEALLNMLISDDKISAMEDSLKKIDLLKGGMKKVGHLEDSEFNLDELNNPGAEGVMDYGEEVFGRVRNDEEIKEIKRLREEKQEARRSAKAKRAADDSIVATAKVSQAKSKMADMYNFISSRQQEVFEKKFGELDIDGNGIITLQELFKRMYRGKDKETGRAFMQVFDLNKDKTIDEREFVIVAALNDKLTGRQTESVDSPLELDLDSLAQHITAYKELFEVTDQDADGRLTLEDIMLVISLSGDLAVGSDPEVVQHVHDTIDSDDNGTIDFIEFLTYIPFFLKLHKKIVKSRHITIAEVERAREAVKNAVIKIKSNMNATLTAF